MSRPIRHMAPLLWETMVTGRTTGAQNDIVQAARLTIPRDRFVTLHAWSTTVQTGTTAAPVSQAISDPTIVCAFGLLVFTPGGPDVPPIISTTRGASDSGMSNIILHPGDQLIAAWQGLAANARCYARIHGIYTLLSDLL